MRKILLTFIIVLTTSLSYGQFKLGVKAGMNANLYSLNFEDITNQLNINEAGKSAGFHAGLQLRLETKLGLYFGVDGLYTYTPERLDISGENGISSNLSIRHHGIDIPVLVGFKIAFFRVYAGPKFYINVGETLSKSLLSNNKINYNLDKNVFGYQVGLGFDILKKITVDVTYNGMFKKGTQTITIDNIVNKGNVTSRQLWVTLGFLF